MRHAKYNLRSTEPRPRAAPQSYGLRRKVSLTGLPEDALWRSHGPLTKAGITLLEMVIVVAIIALLATMVIGIATNIDNQSRKQLTKSTLAILNSALQQFQDYGYRHKDNLGYTSDERDFYLGLEFPLDCNDMLENEIKPILEKVLSTETAPTTVTIEPLDADGYDPNCSGSAVLYYFLSRIPQCRQTLDRIDGSLITNEGSMGSDMKITIDGQEYPFFMFIDAWQRPLRYDYYDEGYYYESPPDFNLMNKSKRTFPLITSAGPDKLFDTADDITNR